jgi:hypothetical protein
MDTVENSTMPYKRTHTATPITAKMRQAESDVRSIVPISITYSNRVLNVQKNIFVECNIFYATLRLIKMSKMSHNQCGRLFNAQKVT